MFHTSLLIYMLAICFLLFLSPSLAVHSFTAGNYSDDEDFVLGVLIPTTVVIHEELREIDIDCREGPVRRQLKRDLFRWKYNDLHVPLPPVPRKVPPTHVPARDVWVKILEYGTGNEWRNKVGPVDPHRFMEIAMSIDWRYLKSAKHDEYNRSLIALEVLKHARTYENFIFEYGARKDAVADYFERFCDGVIELYEHVLLVPSRDQLQAAEYYLNVIRDPLPKFPCVIDGRHIPSEIGSYDWYSYKHKEHARCALVICMRVSLSPVWASLNNYPRLGDGPALRMTRLYEDMNEVFGEFELLADCAYSACDGCFSHGIDREWLETAPADVRYLVEVINKVRTCIERFFGILRKCWDIVDDCKSPTRGDERHCKALLTVLILTTLAIEDGVLDPASRRFHEVTRHFVRDII